MQKNPHKVGGDTPMFYSRKQTDKGVTVVAALHKYAVSTAQRAQQSYCTKLNFQLMIAATVTVEQQVIVI